MTSTNELGATVLFDGECPRTFTGKAVENISGGQFVLCSGTGNNPVTSGAESYVASDIELCLVSANVTEGSGVSQINGIALDDISSGAYGTVATRGAYIVKCGGSVIEGTIVEAMDAHSVRTLTSGEPTGAFANTCGAKNIGRAMAAGASGTNLYTIVYFNF